MKLESQTPNKSLGKQHKKHIPNESNFENFKTQLANLFNKIDESESEGYNENLIQTFLEESFYKVTNLVNKKERLDLVIFSGKTNETNVEVILEVKKPDSNEMISAKKPNNKALHQLVLYYFRERIDGENTNIKNLVATDVHNWFIFDANVFEKAFYENKKLVKDYKNWRDDKKVSSKTDLFYNEIAKPFIEKLESLECTYFNLKDFVELLYQEDEQSLTKLTNLYKIISPKFILKESFTDDSNKLDKNFYNELLHIIGLKEIKEKKKLLIQRKPENERDSGSLIELAISKLETEYSLIETNNLEKIKAFGETKDERIFTIALELCITWTNRILFLKLLEAQLVNYHKGDKDYLFLNTKTIDRFNELYKLFHDVLACKINKRRPEITEKYFRIPYLNSSLFDFADIEKLTFRINSIDDNATLKFISKTILKDEKKQSDGLKTLEYLFKFLDKYDFATVETKLVRKDDRTLINASILGKVFEKINGYKDGAVFTPAFITMYMCRQAIRLAVIQKFKDETDFNSDDFEELKVYIDRTYELYKKDEILKVNKIIDSLKLCDPAVGSGHFLVSALNEIIAIKSELNILADAEGVPIPREYKIEVVDDELDIRNEQTDEVFKYEIINEKPTTNAQFIQKTLFHEKQKLIENCLFGVDINPNSVKICRLRLWIELLKNSYYRPEENYTDLETLPNIDINIKEGNSLISRFALDENLKKALKDTDYTFEDYRNKVNQYKSELDGGKKAELLDIFKQIKEAFKTELYKHHPVVTKLRNKEKRLFELNSPALFDKYSEGEKEVLSKKINKDIKKFKEEIEAIKNNKIYQNAFEWRFEFPEVLDNDGKFLGFDVVIGNPPYVYRNYEYQGAKKYFAQEFKSTEGNFDLYKFFVEKTVRITSHNGISSLIVPNTFLSAKTYDKLRNFIIDNSTILEVFDLGENVFEGITVENVILNQRNDGSEGYETKVKIKRDRESEFKELDNEYKINLVEIFNNENSFNIYLDEMSYSLVNKLRVDTIKLGEIAYCTVGINTGYIKDEMTSEEKLDATYHKMLSGRDIGIYSVEWKNIWIKYDKDFVKSFGKRGRTLPPEYIFQNEKILVQRTRRGLERKLVCYYDSEKFYNLNRLSNIVSTDSTYSLKYITSLLNSSLLDYFFNVYFNEYEVKPLHLSILPIKKISPKAQEPFIKLVDEILEKKKLGEDTQDLEDKIDEMVYELYELTPEEIAIVEGKS